jgi:hypothetical protein
MSYIFQVVNKPNTYWDGKINYVKSERKRSYGWSYSYHTVQRKVLEEIKDDWRPNFSSTLEVENDIRRAKRLMTHYNVQRMRKGARGFPMLVLKRVEYVPVKKESITTTGLPQLREAQRILESFGSTMADCYGRLPLGPKDDVIFEVAVKRKGKSIEAMRDLGKGMSHGAFTFFRTKGEYVHARLALGDKIDRIYYIQGDNLNKSGEAAL